MALRGLFPSQGTNTGFPVARLEAWGPRPFPSGRRAGRNQGTSSWMGASFGPSDSPLSHGVPGAPRLPARHWARRAASSHNAGSRPRGWRGRVAMTTATVARARARCPPPRPPPPVAERTTTPAPGCGKGPGQPPDVGAGLGRWLQSLAPGSGCGGGGGRGARRAGAPPGAWGAEPRGAEAARARGGLRRPLGTTFPSAAARWAARRTQSKRNCCGT